jgi:hypothetical protein
MKNILAALLLLGLLLPLSAQERPAEEIDWNRARQLQQRVQRGETLGDEDRAYLDRARALRRQGQGPPQPHPAPPPTESTGLVPLSDMGAAGSYKGFDGGLYGGGRNQPPEAHLQLALRQAAQIRPLDAAGKPAADGSIVLLAIGMSNTTHEFSMFKAHADVDAQKNPRLVIVDGAQGGKAALEWIAGDEPRGNAVWEVADQRLRAAGASPEQVQVLFIKQAIITPARLGEFPEHARRLQHGLAGILNIAKNRYPNARLAYLTGRTYAGYAATPLNPEPYAYESAFSVRWVIEAQMAGEASLNADEARGPVKAPVALWGPYLWADGTSGRKLDQLAYIRADFTPDGTHPSPTGRQKVAQLLLDHFKTDPTARTWFLAQP